MTDIDYSTLDRPEVLAYLFHPRKETLPPESSDHAVDISIPVGDGIVIGGRFYWVNSAAPTILFFHGNGEIVSDYDEMGPLYNKLGLNFFPVDYRGYGQSTGSPTVIGMMADCHEIFKFTQTWLKEKQHSGPLIIMGRSLGSASALELASHYQEQFDALIIESGFAYASPLLKLLGVDVDAIGFTESNGFANIDKITSYQKPSLIIHAEHDHIIPFADGKALYHSCGAADKTLLKIPGANHNNLLYIGFTDYMDAVKSLSEKIR